MSLNYQLAQGFRRAEHCWRGLESMEGRGEIQPQLWAPAELGARGVWYLLQPRGSALVNKNMVPCSW